MKNARIILLSACCLLLSQQFPRAEYRELNKRFHRATSHVTIRKIDKPTPANLDYAASISNPLLDEPQQCKPKAPRKTIKPANCSFGGVLSDQCAAIQSTPLTKAEIGLAMAWTPLIKKIWENFKADRFIKIENAVLGEKWADSSVWVPYQKIVVAYVHGAGDSAQLWVKIEFMPWVKFIKGLRDNCDGFKELYGRVSLDGISVQLKASIFNWMGSEYCARELSKEEVVDWANILASYWYPKFNTDIMDLNGQAVWPGSEIEPKILGELHGQTVRDPFIVIRGSPYEEPFYTVLMVDFKAKKSDMISKAKNPQEQRNIAGADTMKTTSPELSKNFIENNNRFEKEIIENGNYIQWARKDSAWRSLQLKAERALPADQTAIVGNDGWIFFNKDIECLNAGDLSSQSPEKNPIPHLVVLHEYLAKNGIFLLFVVVPDKAEVYFDQLPEPHYQESSSIINPFFRKFLKDVQASGIEVIDLLPLFLAAKKDDAVAGEGVYQKQDTHWTSRGIEIAARVIADRIKQYQWYNTAVQTPNQYSTKDTTFYGRAIWWISSRQRAVLIFPRFY
jgi:hypothetical protein